MVGCEIASGKARGCRTGFAGIKIFDAFSWDDIETITVVDDVVTALTLASGKRAYRFELEEEVGSFGQVMTMSRQNGSKVNAETLTVPFNGLSSTDIETFDNLASTNFCAVIHYSDGTYRLAGRNNGMSVETDTETSGTAHEDRNGTEIVAMTKEPRKAPFIGANIVASLQIAAS